MKDIRTGTSGSTVLSVMRVLADHNCSTCHNDREENLHFTQPELYSWPPSRKKNSSHQRSKLHKHKVLPTWGNCILLSFPFPFQPIDPHRVYYSNFILNSHRYRSLWQGISWSIKVMLSLTVIALLAVFQINVHVIVAHLEYVCMKIPRLALNELGLEMEAIYLQSLN